MTISSKATPKSCGCKHCRLGRPHATAIIKKEERAARRLAKQALRADPLEAVIAPAHRGTYTD